MKNTFLALLALASLVLMAPAARAEPQSPPANFDRVQRADGARVVPEKFLRDWDPINHFLRLRRRPQKRRSRRRA